MKKILISILTLIIFGCNPVDCFESTGDIIQQEINLDSFNRIEVGNEVTLIIKQGNTQKIILETGKNLIENVCIEVIDGKLFMKDESACNLNRDYAVTKVYVTSPNVKEIRSNTARDIISDGILSYTELSLISEDFHKPKALNIGDFNLEINSNYLNIISNGNSIFSLKGTTNNLNIGFHSGSTRFNGKELTTNNVFITQKSTNDILINPLIKIKGTIFSIGDVISYNQPSIIELEELYTGTLIFK